MRRNLSQQEIKSAVDNIRSVLAGNGRGISNEKVNLENYRGLKKKCNALLELHARMEAQVVKAGELDESAVKACMDSLEKLLPLVQELIGVQSDVLNQFASGSRESKGH